jgi:hypothetical protein
MNLSETDKNQIIQLIKDGKKLPPKYIYNRLAIWCKTPTVSAMVTAQLLVG